MKNQTHLLIVIDRSASMNTVKSDAEAAINQFLDEQRAVEGDCVVTLIDFDAPGRYGTGWATPIGGDDDWYRLIETDKPIKYVNPYALHPRGNTALYDAVGKAVTDLGARLARRNEQARPDNVIVIVQTDGEENSSRTWTKEQIVALIDQQQNVYNWSFVFLGAGPDTFGVGEALGFNTRVYNDGAGASYGSTYSVASLAVAESRTSGAPVAGGTTNV
jgi:hypothetical protein